MKREKIVLVIILCICFAIANITVAAENEDDGYFLDEVVSTATKTEKKLENVPAVVTIITSEEIEATPARTVGDLLGDLPGMDASEPQGVGLVTPQTLTMRGNGFTGHTLVLLDGQRVNCPSTDYTYLTMIPIRAVEKIEVIRGPFSALYGSSGGGGVINIVTKDGGKATYVEPFVSAGDYGRNDYGVNAGIVGDNLSFGLFYDHKEVDNYYLYDDFDLDDTNLGYSHDRVHFKLTGTLGEETEFHVDGGTVAGSTDYGIGENLGIERYKDYEQPYLNFQASRYLSEKIELKGRVDWLRSESDYFGETLINVSYPAFGPPIPSFNYSPSINHTTADRSSGDVTFNYYFSPDRILTLGSEAIFWNYQKSIRHSETGELLEVQGREGEVTDKDDSLYSLYAQYDTLVAGNLELVLGTRFDSYDSFGSEVSPKGTLRWNYRKGGNIKASVGKGFRAPNLSQLYSAPWTISQFIVYQGNPDLEAERLVSYEFSLEQYAMDYALFFRMTPYYTDAENFITSVRETDPINPSGQIMYPKNVDEVDIKGVDLEITYRVSTPLTLFVNYNYNETEDGQTGEILDGYPKNSGSVGFKGNYHVDSDWRVFGSYTARYRGEWTETSWGRVAVTETVGDYWCHNASIGAEWREMITLKIDAFNLLNDRTAIGIDDYPAERNFLAEVSMKYTF